MINYCNSQKMTEEKHELNKVIGSVVIKQEHEDDYLKRQVFVHENAININNINLKEPIKDNLLEHYETSHLTIKMELYSDDTRSNKFNCKLNIEDKTVAGSEFQENSPKVEVEYEYNCLKGEVFLPKTTSSQICYNEVKIEDEIISADIKLKFNSKQLFCNNCDIKYEDYCNKCRMLVHILDRNVFSNKASAGVPRNILELRESPYHVGIFALNIIPKYVTFGPFIGLNTLDCFWRIKSGRFIVSDDKLKFLNWMQYINSAKSISEQNLLVFQYEGNLYYRSIREIGVGEELLVYFGEVNGSSLNKDVETRIIPPTETYIEPVFACTFCCLGFDSKLHLIEHKSICCNGSDGSSSVEDITQCLFCKIFMEQKEYLQYHMDYCYEKNARQCLLPTPDSQVINLKQHSLATKKSKRQLRETHNCLQCKYKTKYKSDLKKHANKHYKVKVHSCKICFKRFKRRETLKRHMIFIHSTNFKQKEKQMCFKRAYKCTKCEYETFVLSHFKNHLISHEKVKKLKCSDCEFRTNYKYNLTAHRLEKHLSSEENAQKLKCPHCDYVTHRKDYYERHLDKHGNVKRFKCSECDYATYRKDYLKRHFYRHETVKRFKCAECEFITNYKSNLNAHRLKIHLGPKEKVKRFVCSECHYSTNSRGHFTNHSYTHGSAKQFKCTHCEYGTNHKSDLKRHADAKHQRIKTYKCSNCQFETADKGTMQQHRYTHNTYGNGDERKFKCSSCGYRTDRKSNLTMHVNTKHSSNGEKYKCLKCDFETGIKNYFERHIYVHTGVKQFKCSECKFETNYMCSLNKHKSVKHPKVEEVKT